MAARAIADLKSGAAYDPDPSMLVSKTIATDYCSRSTCPNFEAFVYDIFEGDQDLISYVQRAIGYSITGLTSEQCLFILIGEGANGKSTFVNVISKLLGDYSKAAASQTLVAKGSTSVGDDLVDLVGARLIPVSETEEGEGLAEAKIKQMTGGDILKGRLLSGLSPYAAYVDTYCACTYIKVKRAVASKGNYTAF